MLEIINIIIKRREIAKQEGRLIYPEPLISEIRKRRKIKLTVIDKTYFGILVNRTADFVENVLRNLRSPDFWSNYATNIVAGKLVSMIIK